MCLPHRQERLYLSFVNFTFLRTHETEDDQLNGKLQFHDGEAFQ